MSDEIPVETKPKSNLAALDDKDVAIANYIFYLLALASLMPLFLLFGGYYVQGLALNICLKTSLCLIL